MNSENNYHIPITDILTQYPFRDSKKAYENLNRILEKLKKTPSFKGDVKTFLERIVCIALEAPDPDSALNNLERYIEAATEPGEFLSRVEKDPQALQVLVYLFGTSPYLSDILIRNPHYLVWLSDPAYLRSQKNKEALYHELVDLLRSGSSKKEKLAILRTFKKRENLRIGSRDILGYGSLKEITEEISDLADVLIQGAYEICEHELKEKYGTPFYQDAQGEPRECKFTVLGMGKLGGRELNFSSDIDLMYLYSFDPGETKDGIPGRISNVEYFKKLSAEITSTLSNVTPEGYVYRVDLRLRPEGKSGNIANSLRSYELYYESWGETWERLALIKVRPVAGDMALGTAFLETVRPFVYRKYMDYSAINEVKTLKDRIDRKISGIGEKNLHVKLGFGGIREVEFSVQALQLLYGGKIPEVREKNTLLALEKLLQHNLLTIEDHDHLRDAYIFLRDVEHKLQIVHEFQTHTLPTDPEALELCARRLGYRPRSEDREAKAEDQRSQSSIFDPRSSTAVEQFMRDYRIHTFRVNQIFQGLFEGSLYGSSPRSIPEMMLILDQDFPREQAHQILQKYQFQDISRSYHNVLLLRDGPTFVHYSAKTRGLLANIMPVILEYAGKSPDPDQALNNLEKFVSAAGARTTLYSLLANNPKVLELLLQLFGQSDFLSGTLIHYPEMLDVLLDPEVMERTKSKEQMYQELKVALTGAPDRISKLRRFKQAETLRIGVRDIAGKADFPRTLRALSDLADTCVQVAYEIAREELYNQYGIPQVDGRECEFAIMALGKLGGQELNYTSDLDILYVYKASGWTSRGRIENHLYFLNLIELLNKILSEPGTDPFAYKLDPRLRPEGKKGPLAIAFKTYQDYYWTRAETWERQALTKIRFVAGNENLGNTFIRMVHDFVYAKTHPRASLQAEIREMKKKMEAKIAREVFEQSHHVKLGSGGIVDIEFMVQFLQLQHGPENSSVRQANTLFALDALYKGRFLSETAYNRLRESYIFLRTVENRLGIVQELSIKTLPTSPEEKTKLAKRLGYFGNQPSKTFLKDYEAHTIAVRGIYKKIFWEVMSDERNEE